jgi:integrase
MAKPKPKQLTQLAVEKLRYNADWGDPNEIADHSRKQLRLVIQRSNTRSFAVRTRLSSGKTIKITLRDVGLDLAKARKATDAVLEEIAAGRDPRQAKQAAKATNLGGVVELYLKDKASAVRSRSLIEIERHLRKHWAPLHARPIAEVRKGEVAARLLELKSENGPVAANRSRSSLLAMFDWAVDQDLIEVNVVASTKKPHNGERSRERVLSLEELQEIWQATGGGGAHDAVVRLLMLLGQRKGEVGGMTWREVDLDRALWSLPGERVKNGLPHVVPLPRQAVEIIRAVPRRGDFVFGDRGDAPFSGWSRCKRRLDDRIARRRAEQRLGRELAKGEKPAASDHLASWVVHDLRRSFVTHVNDLGIAPHVVEAAINHVSGEAKRGVAGTYNKALYLAERTRALQAWADHLTGISTSEVVEFPAARSA